MSQLYASAIFGSGEVAHRLSEAEVVAFVLVDLAIILAAARSSAGCS